MAIPLGLQLYTVRDQTALDFARTLRAVAGMGYQSVQLAGFGNLKTVKEVKRALDDAGLKVCGTHCRIDRLESELNAVLDETRLLNDNYIVIPMVDEKRRNTAAAWKETAGKMNTIGQQLSAQGFELGYHNHAAEFQMFEGQSGYDILWNNSSPEFLRAELDVYWVQHAGGDPLGWINILGKRIASLHIKDMAAGPDKKLTEVGNGVLDFRAIFAAGQALGIDKFIVEQDNTYGKPTLEAARNSIENLQRMGLV